MMKSVLCFWKAISTLFPHKAQPLDLHLDSNSIFIDLKCHVTDDADPAQIPEVHGSRWDPNKDCVLRYRIPLTATSQLTSLHGPL